MTETPQQKYNKQYMKTITIPINTKTETEIIDWLNAQPNKSGYIKSLVRADIAKAKRKAAQQAQQDK